MFKCSSTFRFPIFVCKYAPCCCTSLVCGVDRGSGGRVVPSSGNSVHCDGVIGARVQTGDGGGGLMARDGDLLRSLTTWTK